MDGRDLPEVNIINADKIFHAGCYGLFTLVISHGFKKAQQSRRLLLSALIATLYGLGMEWVQGTFFPHRMLDLYDAAANAFGAFLVALLFPYLVRK
jgi:VanZ family protein